MRALLVGLLLLLAGCSQPSPAGPAGTKPLEPSYAPPSFTETTGAIDGLVVTEEQAPVPGAIVRTLSEEHAATTDAEGRFSLSRLEPGDYVLQVDALGMQSVARKTAVVAGEVASLTIVLLPIPSTEPYTRTATFNGKTSCTVSYRSAVNFLRPSCSVAAGALFPNDKWNHNHAAAAGFVDVLVETSWRPTYSYGNELYQTIGGKPKEAFLQVDEGEGQSPLRILITATEWAAWSQRNNANLSESGGTISISTFAAHNLVREPSPAHVGMVMDQSFTVYLTLSYLGPMPAQLTRVPDA